MFFLLDCWCKIILFYVSQSVWQMVFFSYSFALCCWHLDVLCSCLLGYESPFEHPILSLELRNSWLYFNWKFCLMYKFYLSSFFLFYYEFLCLISWVYFDLLKVCITSLLFLICIILFRLYFWHLFFSFLCLLMTKVSISTFICYPKLSLTWGL